MGGLWTCRSLSAYRAARHWIGPWLEAGQATASPRWCNLWQPLGSEDLSSNKVVDDQCAALDHKHTYILVLNSYGIVPAGWLLSTFFTKNTSE